MNLAIQNDDSVGGFKGIYSDDENEDVNDDVGDFN